MDSTKLKLIKKKHKRCSTLPSTELEPEEENELSTDGGGSNYFTLGAAMVIQRLFLYVAIVFPRRPKTIIHTIPPYHKYTVIKLLGDIVDDDDSLEDK